VVEAVLPTQQKFQVHLVALVVEAGEIQARAEIQLLIKVTQVETEQALELVVVEVLALSVLMPQEAMAVTEALVFLTQSQAHL
jgi:hypothetical protein